MLQGRVSSSFAAEASVRLCKQRCSFEGRSFTAWCHVCGKERRYKMGGATGSGCRWKGQLGVLTNVEESRTKFRTRPLRDGNLVGCSHASRRPSLLQLPQVLCCGAERSASIFKGPILPMVMPLDILSFSWLIASNCDVTRFSSYLVRSPRRPKLLRSNATSN